MMYVKLESLTNEEIVSAYKAWISAKDEDVELGTKILRIKELEAEIQRRKL